MKSLRFWLISLLIFIGFVLNVERIDVGETTDVVNLASFVYVLSGVIVVSIILLPRSWNFSVFSLAVFWALVYLSIKLLIDPGSLIGGINTYLTIVEFGIIIVFVILTRKVTDNLHILEETIANITLADVSGRVKNFDEAADDVSKEFTRSRRYKRNVGVVVIKLEPENTQAEIGMLSEDILKLVMSRFSMSNLIRLLDKEIRRPDLILEQYNENRIVLILPEADTEAVHAVSNNIQKIIETRIGNKFSVGTAVFPDNAITFDDLLEFAEENIDKNKNVFEVQNDVRHDVQI